MARNAQKVKVRLLGGFKCGADTTIDLREGGSHQIAFPDSPSSLFEKPNPLSEQPGSRHQVVYVWDPSILPQGADRIYSCLKRHPLNPGSSEQQEDPTAPLEPV